jgi:hypothetical protein
MDLREHLALRGRVTFDLWRNGVLVERDEGPNLCTDSFRIALISTLLGASFDVGKQPAYIAVGSGDTPPAVSDTVLTNPFAKNLNNLEVLPGGLVLAAWWDIYTHEANDLQTGLDGPIHEFGLVAADGTLLARKVRVEGIDKTTAIALRGAWFINF